MNNETTNFEANPLFPSGDWEGFFLYPYGPKDKGEMLCNLNFQAGKIKGHGTDEAGFFTLKGNYDSANYLCKITKQYATHSVEYQGDVDENGIWGKWIISESWSGGFHIWPRKKDHNEAASEKESIKAIKLKGNAIW